MTSEREPLGNHPEPPPPDQGKQAGTTPPPFRGRWFPEPVPSGSRRAEKRRQITTTFTKIHGRPPADDTELDTWLQEITAR